MRVWYVFRFSSIIRNQSFSKIFITSGFTPNSTGPRRLQLDQEVPDVLLKLPRLTGFVETSGVTKKGGKKWRMILKSYPVMWGSTINKHYIRDETHYDIRIPPALWIKHYWNNQQILESFRPGPFFGFFFPETQWKTLTWPRPCHSFLWCFAAGFGPVCFSETEAKEGPTFLLM